MRDKPRLSFPQLVNMSFGFLGIQFGFGLQLANMSAIYSKLGADPSKIPVLWLAGPMTGLLVQPIILKHLWKGLYIKSADATWTFTWRDGTPDTVPISLGLGWVIPRGNQPAFNFFVSGEWTAYRNHAAVAPQTTVRLGMTVAFPGLELW